MVCRLVCCVSGLCHIHTETDPGIGFGWVVFGGNPTIAVENSEDESLCVWELWGHSIAVKQQ